MPILISHPTGNANVRAAAAAFHDAGWLQSLHLALGWPAASWLPPALQRRGFQLPPSLLRVHPRLEPARLLASRVGWSGLTRHETGPLSVDRIYRQVDAAVARSLRTANGRPGSATLVYAYEDAALATFESAARLGLRRIYELPIGYWRFARRLFQEEAQLRPAWASTLDGLADSATKLNRKDSELSLANLIVVPSRFVRQTLADYPNGNLAPVAVLPYGCPVPSSLRLRCGASSSQLRVLFVGGLSQRKGLADLLDAFQLLDAATFTLTLIGRRVGGACAPLEKALSEHRWLTGLPHSGVLEEMRHHDVLVLPSLFEGFPLVIGEALAQGMVVIATSNAAAEDLIDHGHEGFIVPIRSAEKIAMYLDHLASDRELLKAMSNSALDRASRWTWCHYQQTLRKIVEPFLYPWESEIN